MRSVCLGIDPGTQIMGWAFVGFDGDKFELLESGVIKPRGKLPRTTRNMLIAKTLNQIFNKRQPTFIALEKAFKGKHATGVIGPAESRGVVMALAAIYGADLEDYEASKIKKAVTGNGKAGKESVARAVQTYLRLEDIPVHDDETDAMAIAITGLLRTQQHAECAGK